MIFAAMSIGSPVGDLRLVADDEALVAILWPNDEPGRVPIGPVQEKTDHPILVEATSQLRDYFAGQRRSFTVPLQFRGTEFQRQVWRALMDIPFGETRSYAEIAQAIGRPAATRAVGAANGRNPLSIIAPCHRVIGKNGTLTGFAGGLNAKTMLLELERRVARRERWCSL